MTENELSELLAAEGLDDTALNHMEVEEDGEVTRATICIGTTALETADGWINTRLSVEFDADAVDPALQWYGWYLFSASGESVRGEGAFSLTPGTEEEYRESFGAACCQAREYETLVHDNLGALIHDGSAAHTSMAIFSVANGDFDSLDEWHAYQENRMAELGDCAA